METIPLRCVDCPFIAPVLDRLRNLLNEEEILELHRSRMTEFIAEDLIDRRLDQLDRELSEVYRQLHELSFRTIGCLGVLLTQVRDDDAHITASHCRSPWQDLP